jgi:hypothetical protein
MVSGARLRHHLPVIGRTQKLRVPKTCRKIVPMDTDPDIDTDKIDEDVLALLFLTSFREGKEFFWRAWKGHDWNALGRLHNRGLIHDARNKSKSLTFTEEGYEEAKRLFEVKYVRK